MEILKILCLVLLTLFSTSSSAKHINIKVEGQTNIAKTDDNFICATIDWWPPTKCDYNQCPWGQAGALNLDLDNKILRNAINAFKSFRIRLGGSIQDQLVYNVGNSYKEHCEPFKADNSSLFRFTQGCLPQKRWDELFGFFNNTGVKLTFSLNALYGKKPSKEDPVLWVGDWDSSNSREFMTYNAYQGYKVESYELGNELATPGVSARLESDAYAKDITELSKIVKELYPNPTMRPQVIGAASFYNQEWYNKFLQLIEENVVQAVTHHIYSLGAGLDPKLINKVTDPYYLDQFAQVFQNVKETVQRFGPYAGAWVGESGGAYNSGGKEVSHSFANGFWYLDQLGMSAAFDHKVYCRQALVGGNYALLNTTTFIPNPDYYGALLWHRLMGQEVLSVTHNGPRYLRAYTHCSRNKPGIASLLINMSNSTSYEVKFLEDYTTHSSRKQLLSTSKREEYHLTPKDGNILSDVLLLNGKPLKLTKSLEIPELKPKLVGAFKPIQVAPHSFVYVVSKGFKAAACGVDSNLG